MPEVRRAQKKKSGLIIEGADGPIRKMRSRKKPARKCRMCGKDPAPNYFYCPSCHHRVSHYSVAMEEEQDEFGLSGG